MTFVRTDAEAPSLSLPTLSGETFTLAENTPESYTVAVFYRGNHCPICAGYLKEFEENYDALKEAGIEVVAVSMDPKEKAETTEKKVAESMGLDKLKTRIAYGLTIKGALAWGLYLSHKIEGSSEPDVFSEAGLFVMHPDNTVFMAQIQSAPFTRPSIQQLIGGLKFAKEHNYPVRGTYTKTV
jgi:alkyl hydroperoxide reductase subunit AhpC